MGTGRVARPLTKTEYTDIEDKIEYFIVALLTVEEDFVDYNAPFVTASLEPGLQIPWKRSKLLVLKHFLNITRSARQPNEYQDVNDFLQSQPKATRKRKHHEIQEPELVDVDPAPKKSKAEVVQEAVNADVTIQAEPAKLVPCSCSQLHVKLKRMMDHMLPLLAEIRTFCDPTITVGDAKLIVGTRTYYPTNDEWVQLNKGQSVVVLK